MAERTGIFVFTSAQTTNNALNREYKDLFLQREAIQARMRVIEEELGKEEYGKLVVEIEGVVVEKLKLHLGRGKRRARRKLP
jgi:hypothetical protein